MAFLISIPDWDFITSLKMLARKSSLLSIYAGAKIFIQGQEEIFNNEGQ